MDYWRYDKREYPPRIHVPGTANGVQVSEKRLRVLVLGGEAVYDLFYSILVANIRCWGYETNLLSRSQASDPQIWREMEGDILLYDMDVSPQPLPVLGAGSEETSLALADAVFTGIARPRARLLVALSSHSVSRHSLERVGAITFLRKPFDMRHLERYLRVFQKLLYGEAEYLAESVSALPVLARRVRRLLANDGEFVEETPLPSQRSTRILVADDRQEVTQVIRQSLMERENLCEQYEVREVHDGLELLEQCLSWKPQCVVTDLLMPWLNGYEVIRCLMTNSSQPVPAFILFSTLSQRETLENRAQLQDKAVLYIDKPFEVEHLLALIEQALAQ